jgi:hypothetical protein
MKGVHLLLFGVFCLLLLSNGINVGIGHACNTMGIYHDTIIKFATLDSFCFFCSLFPYPPTTRTPTRAYVKRMKEMRHVIHDTRISNGQCFRRDVTVRYGLQGHAKKTSGKTYTCQNKTIEEGKKMSTWSRGLMSESAIYPERTRRPDVLLFHLLHQTYDPRNVTSPAWSVGLKFRNC